MGAAREGAGMSPPDISEAQFAQGDLARAVQTIAANNLPTTTTEGALECERLMRENGEGNTALWTNPRYLPTTIGLAQALVEAVRQAG
jgi:hypothetical protein